MPELPGRDEQIIQSIIDGTEYTRVPQSRIEYLLLQLKQVIENGRTSDYNDIENKPQINSVTLVGNKSLSDLGIVNPIMIKGRVNSVSDLPANAEPGWLYFVGYSDDADLREYVYTTDERWEFVGYLSMVVDSALSTTSENPVQNKVITNAMVGQKTEGKQYVIDGKTVTAEEGAEIFNDYQGNKATGIESHAEGHGTLATGVNSHAEGASTQATGGSSHSEGSLTKATGICSHAEGASTQATGGLSHAEGTGTQATGDYSHAEGGGTQATGNGSHAEGGATQATGVTSHAEGGGTKAIGNFSHAEGSNTIAKSLYQHVQGKYNVEDANGTYAFIIGNGTENARHDAFAIDWNGNIYVNGDTTGVNVSTLSSILTPISESAYDALTTKDKPLYFIYED